MKKYSNKDFDLAFGGMSDKLKRSANMGSSFGICETLFLPLYALKIKKHANLKIFKHRCFIEILKKR